MSTNALAVAVIVLALVVVWQVYFTQNLLDDVAQLRLAHTETKRRLASHLQHHQRARQRSCPHPLWQMDYAQDGHPIDSCSSCGITRPWQLDFSLSHDGAGR